MEKRLRTRRTSIAQSRTRPGGTARRNARKESPTKSRPEKRSPARIEANPEGPARLHEGREQLPGTECSRPFRSAPARSEYPAPLPLPALDPPPVAVIPPGLDRQTRPRPRRKCCPYKHNGNDSEKPRPRYSVEKPLIDCAHPISASRYITVHFGILLPELVGTIPV